MARTLVIPVMCLLAGCGGPDVPAPVDPAEAGRQLGAALESWKAGEPHAGLAARNPPVVFSEPLWEGGTRLLTYEVGPVELNGRQGRCTAKLTLRGPDGKQYVAILSGVGGWSGAIVSGDLDPRDGTAALGFVNAMKDLPKVTPKGGTLYVFTLP